MTAYTCMMHLSFWSFEVDQKVFTPPKCGIAPCPPFVGQDILDATASALMQPQQEAEPAIRSTCVLGVLICQWLKQGATPTTLLRMLRIL
jgi:hypothetical protein